jgi:adenylate cyclase
MSFMEELKRRKVIRVGIAYLVAAWLFLQVADVLLDPLRVPEWIMPALIVVLALGFPFALIMAWAFEITPTGVQRDPGVDSAAESPADTALGSAVPEKLSIAVLPFVDISPGGDNEHFTDGLTEELLNALRRIPDLRVASRTSCFAFKSKNADVAEVAEKLRVHHLVEGSVRKSGDKLRVAVQLIETSTDRHLWSESYDENLNEIFSMQEDISKRICNALQITLNEKDAPDATTEDPQAYDYYLRGLGFFTAKGGADLDFAIDMFTRATQLDSGFVKAWLKLTVSLAMNAIYHGNEDAQARAEAAAEELYRLAPERADTYSALGWSLLAAEKYDEAMVQFERALEIDPNNFDAYNNYARAAFHQGNLEKALEMFEKAAACDPEDWETVLLSIQIYQKFGDTKGLLAACAEGLRRAERFLQVYPNNQRAYYLGAFALHYAGQKDKAREWIQKALEIAPDDSATRYNVGCFYAKTGDPDRAFANLKQSITSRSWVESDPTLEPLRDDPRYLEYLSTLK